MRCCCSDNASVAGGQRLPRNSKMSNCLWLKSRERSYNRPGAGMCVRHGSASSETEGCRPTAGLSVSAGVVKVAWWCVVFKLPAAHMFCIQSHHLWVVYCCCCYVRYDYIQVSHCWFCLVQYFSFLRFIFDTALVPIKVKNCGLVKSFIWSCFNAGSYLNLIGCLLHVTIHTIRNNYFVSLNFFKVSWSWSNFSQLLLWISAHSGSPLIHSLPQLSGSPVMRGHAGRCVNIDERSMSGTVPSFSSSTVPSFTTMRADMDQLQQQLQQRLSQQRVRNEQHIAAAGWRPASECGMNVDAQSVPAAFSRYSAPPATGVLVKSGPAARPPTTTFISSPSQHANAPAASSAAAAAAMKPGQPLPAAAKPLSHSQSGGPAKSTVSSSAAAPSVTSSATVGRSSPTVASQHVRSPTAYVYLSLR